VVIVTKGAVIQEIKRRLDDEGIEIPFPQRVLTMANRPTVERPEQQGPDGPGGA
jgi:small-conductance mechanosensitive channel